MRKQRLLSGLLALCLLIHLPIFAAASESGAALQKTVEESAAYILDTVKTPQVGAIGGEWAVIGLARSGYPVPQTYWDAYYAEVERSVKACGGVLHAKKYTEYSRVILALTAIGADPRDVAGYDLLTPLGDYEKTIWQGINGPIWALLALDSGEYAVPRNPAAAVQATRQMYVDCILACQLPDGGWSLSGMGETSDPDITGMALQALAKYREQTKVSDAVERALDCMSRQQYAMGGFSAWNSFSSESCVQMLVALCELGIPVTDPRFVKNGHTILDCLLTFRQGDGSFLHTADGAGSSLMASEQGLYCLAAVLRQQEGKNSLYRMQDTMIRVTGTGAGLPGKMPAVVKPAVSAPGRTFPDISGHADQAAIEALAAREILSGMDGGLFCPDQTMTRAQFATAVVRCLGLQAQKGRAFADVPATAWYAEPVETAAVWGIVSGRSAEQFDPEGRISRQEAAVMVTRAAKLCGLDTEMAPETIRDVLSQFGDYRETAPWAEESLAFCYQEGILDDAVLEIHGDEPVRRCEIAQMLFQLLACADLL